MNKKKIVAFALLACGLGVLKYTMFASQEKPTEEEMQAETKLEESENQRGILRAKYLIQLSTGEFDRLLKNIIITQLMLNTALNEDTSDLENILIRLNPEEGKAQVESLKKNKDAIATQVLQNLSKLDIDIPAKEALDEMRSAYYKFENLIDPDND